MTVKRSNQAGVAEFYHHHHNKNNAIHFRQSQRNLIESTRYLGIDKKIRNVKTSVINLNQSIAASLLQRSEKHQDVRKLKKELVKITRDINDINQSIGCLNVILDAVSQM